MANREEIEEEIKLRREQFEYEVARRRKFQDSLRLFVLVYGVIVIGLAITFLLTKTNFSSRFFSSNDSSDAKIAILQAEINDQSESINKLQKSLDDKSQTDNSALAARVDNVSSRVDALESTVLIDPDKALTARLLREKQTTLEGSVKDLKSEIGEMRQASMNLVVAVVGVPLAGLLITMGISYVQNKNKKDTLTIS